MLNPRYPRQVVSRGRPVHWKAYGSASVELSVPVAHSRPMDFAPGTGYGYSHTGYLLLSLMVAGFVAAFLRIPDEEMAVVVFANRYRANPGRIRDAVLETFLPGDEQAG